MKESVHIIIYNSSIVLSVILTVFVLPYTAAGAGLPVYLGAAKASVHL